MEGLTKRVYDFEMKAKRGRGMPCARLLDGFKQACNVRALELTDAKVMCMDRKQWMQWRT